MKYYELIAEKGNQKIIERYIENGDRFIKHIPFNPTIFVKLKEQFANKNVSVEMSSSRWVRVHKTGESKELKAAAEQVVGDKQVTREDIMNIEANMLKQAGFFVKVELKGDDDDAETIKT
jgi:hypothetical protein